VVLFYEYFLTFSDEVRYAWKGKKTWVFYLFWMNRYLPIAYKIWDLSYGGGYQYTQLVTWTSKEITSYCNVTTFTENAYLVLVTLLSQLFLAVRVYAVKGRSKGSLGILSSMTVVQLAYGVVYIAVFRRGAYTFVSLVDPGVYTFATCLQDSTIGTSLQLGYLAQSLVFDFIAFLMIAICSSKSAQVFRTSSLFGRIVQDATVYFLAIVWVHLTLLIYVASIIGSSRILMLFPAITNTITPILICRLVLSLRKASDPNLVRAWNVDHFSTQISTQSRSGGLGGGGGGGRGTHLSPLRFRTLTTSVPMSSEGGGTTVGSENGLTGSTLGAGSLVESGFTIDIRPGGGDEILEFPQRARV